MSELDVRNTNLMLVTIIPDILIKCYLLAMFCVNCQLLLQHALEDLENYITFIMNFSLFWHQIAVMFSHV